MFTTTKQNVLALAAATVLSLNAAAQLKVPAPSTSQTVKQAFALSDVTVDYSRPGIKGRTVYGDLVPFGKTWRTGANASTKITFGEDVKIEGSDLKAGTYAMYSVPNKDSWEIMFYKDLTLGGNVADYKVENEVLRVKVKPTAIASNVENFTINFADIKPNSMNVELLWEKTRVAFNVTANIDEKIMKNIENTVVKDSRPYFQAANYYYENDKDMKQALAWADKAAEQNPKAYWVMALKGKIQLKLKDAKGATETAGKVIELAKADQNDDYVKIGEKIITDSKSIK